MYIDTAGNILLATDNGVGMINFSNQAIKKHLFSEQIYQVKQDKYNADNMWFSTNQMGLIKMDWRNKIVSGTYRDFVYKTKQFFRNGDHHRYAAGGQR